MPIANWSSFQLVMNCTPYTWSRHKTDKLQAAFRPWPHIKPDRPRILISHQTNATPLSFIILLSFNTDAMSSILHWLPCSPLGSGSFGLVSLALNLHDGSLFAAKSAPSSSPAALLSLRNELLILRSLCSPFILRCLGADFSPSQYPSSQPVLRSIFLEYMDGGSLADLLRRSGGKFHDEKLVGHYTRAILQGLDYLHQNGIAHCDIKSHNILIGSSGIKIADFGAARRLGESSALDGTLRGSPLWMAPEVMQGVEQGTPCDIWSLGCTVVEMLQGRPPWAHTNNLAALFLEVGSSQEIPPLPESISAEARDFLLQCLQRDPNARPTAAELLKHPFLCSLPAEAKDAMYEQPSPRSTINFVQSDSESDWEDESMMGSVPILDFSPSQAADVRPTIICAEQAAWKKGSDEASEWMTVRCREMWCEERKVPFMQGAGAAQARKGCEVSFECAEFLRKRKTSVG